MQVRDRHFDFDDVRPFQWNGRFRSKLLNAFSMLFPVGEKFFIQAVRHYKDQITSEKLIGDVDVFFKQEAKHSREHARFNALLEDQGVNLREQERQAFNRLVKCGSTPEDALLVTVCLEQLTEAMAHMLFKLDTVLLRDAGCPVTDMWKWHATEELEHAHVAREVMHQVAEPSKLRWSLKMMQILGHLSAQVASNYWAQNRTWRY